MMSLFEEMFSFPFMTRAFLVGSLIAPCSALLGVVLVLKRYSMIGDGLSHVGFGALALAAALHVSPLLFSIPIVVVCAVLLLGMGENKRISGDASIALISTGALSTGVMVLSLTTGMNTDVCNYLFGSILGMTVTDVIVSAFIAISVMMIYILMYNRIFAVTFDESFVRACGASATGYTLLIAVLAAVVIALGMRMMGALLVSSMIVFPALSAMRVCKRFMSVLYFASAVSLVCLWLGILISYVWATPTGASIAICNLAIFACCSLFCIIRKE